MSSTVAIMSVVLSFIIGLVTSYCLNRFVFVKRYMEEAKRLANLKNGEEVIQQVKQEIREHKESDEFQSLLEVQYRKGIEEGEKRTMRRFSLAYEPFVEVTESFFKKTADAGYTMQMLYDGLPLGDPMKRITNHGEKYKDENVKYLIDSVNQALDKISQMASPIGIPVNVTKNPKIAKKKTG